MPTLKMKKRVDYLKNFGIADEVTIVGQGVNGKMNEVSAAFGLLQLKRLDQDIAKRAELDRRYRENLSSIPGIRLLEHNGRYRRNFCYFPVFIEKEFGRSRDALQDFLRKKNILTRSYFYPLVSQTPCYRHLPSAHPKRLPTATEITNKVLCLPLYTDLTLEQVDMISEQILKARA